MWNVTLVLALAVLAMFVLDVLIGRSLEESWFTGAVARDRAPGRTKLSPGEFFTGPAALLMLSVGLPLSLTRYLGAPLFAVGAGLLGFRLGMIWARRKDGERKATPRDGVNPS